MAAGEIYLDQRDEDGNCHQSPAHEDLRRGSTYLVFRKLEQDVTGFRAFLNKERPGNPKAQDKLAAQFLGRWQNGTPLVFSPDVAVDLDGDPDKPNVMMNDFLYAADDPKGLKCPLSAHIRRANPRDIGGTNDVRRHRILRRGIAYGGPLLPADSSGDGNKRGLLFICANARIDLQFEVIQSNWLNRGEFLGQAGLNRCPLTGANVGGVADAFVESGAVAPVTGLPRFVITRGGDYFFAPGKEALAMIADDVKFVVAEKELPYAGRSMGDAATPRLFSEERLEEFGQKIFGDKNNEAEPVIRVPLPRLALSGGLGLPPVAAADPCRHARRPCARTTRRRRFYGRIEKCRQRTCADRRFRGPAPGRQAGSVHDSPIPRRVPSRRSSTPSPNIALPWSAWPSAATR